MHPTYARTSRNCVRCLLCEYTITQMYARICLFPFLYVVVAAAAVVVIAIECLYGHACDAVIPSIQCVQRKRAATPRRAAAQYATTVDFAHYSHIGRVACWPAGIYSV